MADSSFCLHLSFPLTVPSSGFCGCKTNAAFERWKLSQGRPSVSPCLRPPVSPLPPQRPPPPSVIGPDWTGPSYLRLLLGFLLLLLLPLSLLKQDGFVFRPGVFLRRQRTRQRTRHSRTDGRGQATVSTSSSSMPVRSQLKLKLICRRFQCSRKSTATHTHTHTDRFRGRSGDVSTGAVQRRSHPTET